MAGRAHLFAVRGDRRRVMLVRVTLLLRGRTCSDSALAAVKRDVAVVDLDIALVDVRDARTAHIHDRAVIENRSASPFAAKVSSPGVAEAIVDAAVEADSRAP